MMLAMPSAPALPFGPDVCAAQALGQRSGLPTNENLTSPSPVMFACVCQPQYCVQNPDDSLTSAEVNTKYTPLASFGNRPDVIALVTTACTALSESVVPCE